MIRGDHPTDSPAPDLLPVQFRVAAGILDNLSAGGRLRRELHSLSNQLRVCARQLESHDTDPSLVSMGRAAELLLLTAASAWSVQPQERSDTFRLLRDLCSVSSWRESPSRKLTEALIRSVTRPRNAAAHATLKPVDWLHAPDAPAVAAVLLLGALGVLLGELGFDVESIPCPDVDTRDFETLRRWPPDSVEASEIEALIAALEGQRWLHAVRHAAQALWCILRRLPEASRRKVRQPQDLVALCNEVADPFIAGHASVLLNFSRISGDHGGSGSRGFKVTATASVLAALSVASWAGGVHPPLFDARSLATRTDHLEPDVPPHTVRPRWEMAEALWRPRPDVGPDPRVEPYMVRLLVYVLLRQADREDDLLRDLALDRDDLLLAIRGAQTRIDYSRLYRSAVKAAIFLRVDRASHFVEGGVLNPEDLRKRKGLINRDVPAGRHLIEMVEEYATRREISQLWHSVVSPMERELRSVEHQRALKLLEEIYRTGALSWSRRQMQLFVKSDFENRLWHFVIDRAQDSISRVSDYSHLHHANIFMGEAIGSYFSAESAVDLTAGRRKRQGFNLVEGGVGGANTTQKVLQGILARSDFRRIRYRGFEINEAFVDQANAILRGDFRVYDHDHRAERDPRSRFFASLRDKLIPYEGTDFVECMDMSDGMLSLRRGLEDDDRLEEVDLFLCSYAFHHVPNGRAIRRLLFNQGWSGAVRGATDIMQFRQRLADGLELLLRWRAKNPWNAMHAPRMPDFADAHPHVAHLLQLLPSNLTTYEIRLYLTELRKPPRGDTRPVPPSWVNLVSDHQEDLLRHAYAILRPGGLIAVADPDGYSMYNLQNITRDPEMGIANFLNRQEFCELADGVGFELTSSEFPGIGTWTQVKRATDAEGEPPYEGMTAVPAAKGERSSSELADPNCGYIAIFRKPNLRRHRALVGVGGLHGVV